MVPDGPLCHDCGEIHRIAYKFLSVDDCITKRKQDSEFQEAFLRARSIWQGQAERDFELSDVSSNVRCGYRVRKSYRAFTKSGFKSFYQYWPEQLGVKPSELMDEHGDAFSAYLVEFDQDQCRSVDVFYETVSATTSWKQHATETYFATQAGEMFKSVTSDPKSALLRKVKKAVPHHILQGKQLEMDKSTVHDLGSLPPQSAASSCFVSPPPKSQAAESAIVGLARSAFGESVSRLSAPSAGVGGLSSDEERDGDMSEMPSMAESAGSHAASQRPARNLEEHIARMPLIKIISGTLQPGREERWAKRFISKNGDRPDLPLLIQHLKAVEAAKAMTSTSIASLSDEKLRESVEVLQAVGVDFPSKGKHELLQRQVSLWQARSDRYSPVVVEGVLSVVEPWHDSASTETASQAAPPFDPLSPANALAGGGPVGQAQLLPRHGDQVHRAPSAAGGRLRGSERPGLLPGCALPVRAHREHIRGVRRVLERHVRIFSGAALMESR